MPKKAPPKRGGRPPGDATITDPRFANFQTDPRFRLPSRNRSKTTLDKRFAHALHDNDFTATARVDRYGRKIRSDTKKKALQRLYRQEEEDGGKDDEKNEDEDGDDNNDDDDAVRRELGAANAKYDPARGGGFSSSESESGSEDEAFEGVEEENDAAQQLQADVELGEVTRRLAVVNLDWDHVKSVDLMALFSSFAPTGGRVQKVSVYPSEFGKQRMEREEMEGPPKEIFRNAAAGESARETNDKSESDESAGSDVDSDEEIRKELIQEAGDEDFDSNALRSYQLERLRYYYAVVVCSDLTTAQTIYEATDGTEYLSSSNFLDLRFIPDEVGFDGDEPRDDCDSVPTGYRPLDFVTEALQSSKVKLTWDMDPDESTRKETIRKAFTGSRAEIAENDLNAYLASDSDEEEVPFAEENGEEAPLSKKELARRKMREALGLSNDSREKKGSKSEAVGEMEITFTPALMGDESKKKKREDGEEETTIEKYMRKERERKEKKREIHKAKRIGATEAEAVTGPADGDAKEDLGFDDPFFTTQPEKPSKSANRKEERRKKREARDAAAAESAAQRAQLELVMADNTDSKAAAHLDHFDMKDILRAEKQKRKKGKNKGNKKDVLDQGGLQEDFHMNMEDPRFKAVFDDHEFAIDPSNPKFKATEGMKKLLEKGRKRKQRDDGDGAEDLVARKAAKASRL